MVHGLLGKAARVAATGLAGAVAYDGVKRVARSRLIRNATVTGTAWGLRGFRAAEAGAEKARLAAGDIVSEARERIGEQAPAPGAFEDHDHGHEH
jgi:hypothetical protein